MYTDLRDHDGHLLARIDPERWLLQIQRRGEQTLFDLREMLAPKSGPTETPEEAKVRRAMERIINW
jgi:hypothetical protein